MPNTVDRRVVEMRFDNKDFEKNIGKTMISLETLEKALQMQNGQNGTEKVKKGLFDLGKAAKNIDTNSIANNVENISSRFSTLGLIGASVLQNIGNRIADVAFTLKNKLLAPLNVIKQGGLTRAFNLEQANFQIKGLGIEKNDTAGYYTEVMDAVLGTAYSYDVAAKAASQLAASNVGVIEKEKQLLNGTKATTKYFTGDMTKAILGIAGVASMTGSSFEDISQVFTRVAGQGRVMSNDLNSISARGLNAAATLANYLNKTEKEVRDMVTKGEIDFNTFSAAMTEAFGEHAKDSTKTFMGAMEDVKAALSRIGADFFGPALTAGRDVINSMTPLVDVIHDKIQWALDGSGEVMMKSSKKISAALDLITLSGSSFTGKFGEKFPPLTSMILKGVESISSATENLENGPIDAFKLIGDNLEITADSAKKMAEEGSLTFKTWSTVLREFSKSGKEGSEEVKSYLADMSSELRRYENIFDVFGDQDRKIGAITRAFEGLSKTLDLDVGKVYEAVGEKIGMTSDELSKAIVKGTVSITDLRTALSELVKEGSITDDQFQSFMQTIDFTVLDDKNVAKKIKDFETVWKGLTATFSIFGKIAKNLGSIFVSLLSALSPVGRVLLKVLEAFNDWIVAVDAGSNRTGALLKGIANALNDFGGSLENAGNKVAGAGEDIIGFFNKLKTLIGPIITGVVDTLSAAFEEISNIFGKINFGKLIVNAGVGGFVVAIWNILKTLADFAKSMYESGALFGSLGTVMNQFRLSLLGLQQTLKIYQNGLKANILIKIAGAILMLAVALNIMASIPADQLTLATEAMAAMFAGLVISLNAIDVTSMFGFKKGIIQFAAAILILAIALKEISEVEQLGKGLGGLGAIMLELVAFTYVMKLVKPKSMQRAAFSMIIFAGAIRLLVKPINELGSMDVNTIKQGLTAIGGLMTGMVVFSAALRAINPRSLMRAGASMVLIAVAIKMMVGPINSLGSMKVETLRQGFVGLAGAMAIMAGFALIVTSLSSGGGLLAAGAALVLMATGVRIMAGAVESMGDTKNIGKGLSALFGSMVILAGAMLIMQNAVGGAAAMIIVASALMLIAPSIAILSSLNFTGVVVGLLALAGTIAVFAGASLLLAPVLPLMIALAGTMAILGVGVLALGAGMTLLAAAFATGVLPIIEGVKQLSSALPEIMTNVAAAIGAFMDALVNEIPKVLPILEALFKIFVTVALKYAPAMVQVGLILIIKLLEGIRSKISDITNIAIDIIILFVNTIGARVQDVVDAGFNLMINFINGLANSVATNGPVLIDSIKNLVASVLEVIAGEIPIFGDYAAKAIANYRKGLDKGGEGAKQSAKSTAQGIEKNLKLSNNFSKNSAKPFADLTKAVEKEGKNTSKKAKTTADDANKNLKIKSQTSNGSNAVRGIISGMDSQIPRLRSRSREIASIVDETIRKKNQIHSPSRLLARTGKYLMQGLIKGIDSMESTYQSKADNIATTLITSTNGAISSMGSMAIPNFNLTSAIAQSSDVNLRMNDVRRENEKLAAGISSLTKTLDSMTESMNSRALNNYITVDGSADPSAFADDLIRSFRLNARTV